MVPGRGRAAGGEIHAPWVEEWVSGAPWVALDSVPDPSPRFRREEAHNARCPNTPCRSPGPALKAHPDCSRVREVMLGLRDTRGRGVAAGWLASPASPEQSGRRVPSLEILLADQPRERIRRPESRFPRL